MAPSIQLSPTSCGSVSISSSPTSPSSPPRTLSSDYTKLLPSPPRNEKSSGIATISHHARWQACRFSSRTTRSTHFKTIAFLTSLVVGICLWASDIDLPSVVKLSFKRGWSFIPITFVLIWIQISDQITFPFYLSTTHSFVQLCIGNISYPIDQGSRRQLRWYTRGCHHRLSMNNIISPNEIHCQYF